MDLLSKRKAVITGGSEGIGFGIAEAFAQNGADVMLIARNKEKLDSASSSLSNYEVEVRTISADLSDISTLSRLGDEIVKIWPGIDILVNNAGTLRFTPFEEVEEGEMVTGAIVSVDGGLTTN
jgi:short-subunit dehydrogenase